MSVFAVWCCACLTFLVCNFRWASSVTLFNVIMISKPLFHFSHVVRSLHTQCTTWAKEILSLFMSFDMSKNVMNDTVKLQQLNSSGENLHWLTINIYCDCGTRTWRVWSSLLVSWLFFSVQAALQPVLLRCLFLWSSLYQPQLPASLQDCLHFCDIYSFSLTKPYQGLSYHCHLRR